MRELLIKILICCLLFNFSACGRVENVSKLKDEKQEQDNEKQEQDKKIMIASLLLLVAGVVIVRSLWIERKQKLLRKDVQTDQMKEEVEVVKEGCANQSDER